MTQMRKATFVVLIACLLAVIPASAQASDDPNAGTGNCDVLALAQLQNQGNLLSSLAQIQQWFQEGVQLGTPFDWTAFRARAQRHGTLLTCFPLAPSPWGIGDAFSRTIIWTLNYDPATLLELSVHVVNTSVASCGSFTLVDHNGVSHAFGPFTPNTDTTVPISSFGDHIHLVAFRPLQHNGKWYFDFEWVRSNISLSGSATCL